MNCVGCGVDVEPSQEQVNTAVDEILHTSLEDAKNKSGVCPLCGHSMQEPYSHRKSVQFGLLITILALVAAISFTIHRLHETLRSDAVGESLRRLNRSEDVIGLLGSPIVVAGNVDGELTQDETGWREARLKIPVRGASGEGIAEIVGGKGNGPWVFSTLQVEVAEEHKTVNLITGKISIFEPDAYVEVHSQIAAQADSTLNTKPPSMPDTFPCVLASSVTSVVAAEIGNCSMPIPMEQSDPVYRMEADLRYGHFILRETDLFLNDTFKVPLTRAYNSGDWVHPNHQHAFGNNSNHPYDIAPLGSRNPYTYLMIALEDSEFLYFDRISKGTGYADAVYEQTEVSGRFYQAVQKWNGNGWTTTLADGSRILFPESYNATNMAQGAATVMIAANGQELKLIRDSRRNLKEIRTPHGHFIKFSYDNTSRIIRAEDDLGHSARYSYNRDGMLESVFLPSGRERHYTYDGTLMTLIEDEHRHVLVRNWYRQGKLERQNFGNGNSYSYGYESTPAGSGTATVSLPDGTLKKISLSQFVSEYVRKSSLR